MRHDTVFIDNGYVPPVPLPEGAQYTPETLMERLLVGDPETVIEKLKEFEALGVQQLVLFGDWGMPQRRVMRSLELFAERVMPHFKADTRTPQPAGAAS